MSHSTGFHCARCGTWHPELPLAYSAEAPELWFQLSEERRSKSELTSDLCVIEGRYFFLRGCIDLPITDGEGTFTWGVWVSLSEASFRRVVEFWETPGREQEPARFGWLSTALPGYPSTLSLKSMVHLRPVGERPWVELEPGSHPLADEQQHGITRARVQELAEIVLHGEAQQVEEVIG